MKGEPKSLSSNQMIEMFAKRPTRNHRNSDNVKVFVRFLLFHRYIICVANIETAKMSGSKYNQLTPPFVPSGRERKVIVIPKQAATTNIPTDMGVNKSRKRLFVL
mmetsp:Transcript_13237/g.26893  ORF Transcript_13237/g.26893 Transcript_13237/m.26893 type:complete len:105 (+) Transcript_13237:153-467(+)